MTGSQEPVELPKVELTTVKKYNIKQELDIRKDNWMHFPMTSGIAIYAYDYSDKAQKKYKKKMEKRK